jgi:hypothetical protein
LMLGVQREERLRLRRRRRLGPALPVVAAGDE